MLSSVAEVNIPWAKLASVLVIGCVRLHLGHVEATIRRPNMTWGSLRRTWSLKPRLVVSASIK